MSSRTNDSKAVSGSARKTQANSKQTSGDKKSAEKKSAFKIYKKNPNVKHSFDNHGADGYDA